MRYQYVKFISLVGPVKFETSGLRPLTSIDKLSQAINKSFSLPYYIYNPSRALPLSTAMLSLSLLRYVFFPGSDMEISALSFLVCIPGWFRLENGFKLRSFRPSRPILFPKNRRFIRRGSPSLSSLPLSK